MDDRHFKAFLSLMMCSDPWPCSEEEHEMLIQLAENEAKQRGYDSWYVAYHEFDKTVSAIR